MKTLLETDVCIVGSGITATLVARHFVEAGQRVAMLERTGETYFPETKEQYWKEHTHQDVDNPGISRNYFEGADKLFKDLVSVENANSEMPFRYNMKYGVGGSGAVWGGLSWRFTENDFRTRSRYGYGRDWPISLSDLEPYYAQIEQLYRSSGPEQSKDWPWDNEYAHPAFKLSHLDKVIDKVLRPEFSVTPNAHSVPNTDPKKGGCIGSKTCNYKCPQNARYRPDVRLLPELLENANFQLLTSHPCLYVETDKQTGAVSGVVVQQGDTKGRIKAKLYYLCANTIENLRILLNSKEQTGNATANSSGLLGKYFASHGSVVATVQTQEKLYPRRGRPITSVATNRLFDYKRDELNAQLLEIWNMDWASTIKGGWDPQDALKETMHRGHLGYELFDRLEQDEFRTTMVMIYETEMRETNHVSLSSQRDQLGLPIARVNFQLGKRDKATMHDIYASFSNLDKKPGVVMAQGLGNALNGNHPLGGYCSGENPLDSVLNPRLRSHDHPNLYITGGGSFNSTSALNPTHTISALTLFSLDDPALAF